MLAYEVHRKLHRERDGRLASRNDLLFSSYDPKEDPSTTLPVGASTPEKTPKAVLAKPQINGSQGEWTGEDDLAAPTGKLFIHKPKALKASNVMCVVEHYSDADFESLVQSFQGGTKYQVTEPLEGTYVITDSAGQAARCVCVAENIYSALCIGLDEMGGDQFILQYWCDAPGVFGFMLTPNAASELNGPNGEVTGLDDMTGRLSSGFAGCLSLNGVCGEATNEDDRHRGRGHGKQERKKLAKAMSIGGSGVYTGGKVMGHGAYSLKSAASKANKVAEKASRTINSTLKVLNKVQGAVQRGQAMANQVGAFAGSGSYASMAPAHANELFVNSEHKPMKSHTLGGEQSGIEISHREFVCDAFGPNNSAFVAQKFPMNAGLMSTFAFLSQIACNFEEYEFVTLVWEWIPVITEYVSSGQVGSIVMVSNPNAGAPDFADKLSASQFRGAVTFRPTERGLHGVECDTSQGAKGFLFSRTIAVPRNQDVKTFDMGNFYLCFCNIPNTLNGQTLGELWVTYRVRLRTPKLCVYRGLSIQGDMFYAANNTGATLSASNPWGVANSVYGYGLTNNFGSQITLGGSTLTVYLPSDASGAIRCTMIITGSSYVSGSYGVASVVASGNVIALTGRIVTQTVLNAAYSSNNSVVHIGEWTLSAAPSGTNNTITYTFLSGANMWVQKSQLMIEQINNLGLSGNTVPTVVNSSSGQYYTPSTI